MKKERVLMYLSRNSRGRIVEICLHKWQLRTQKGYTRERVFVTYDEEASAITVVPHLYEKVRVVRRAKKEGIENPKKI